MIYECKCEKCGTITKVDTDTALIGPNYKTYVTAYGYLNTPCIKCNGDAYAVWAGSNGKRFPRTGIFA